MSKAYDLPLADWICIGLHKDTLKAAITSINNGMNLADTIHNDESNRRYIGKILREEVIKQFSGGKRPMLEVILNGVDARSKNMEGEHYIKVKCRRRNFYTYDNGQGMSLDEILRLLIIPFNTEKNGLDEIGRFGVGFLSTFNYCLQRPEKVHVLVDTRTENEGWSIDFYATEENVDGLRMRIKKSRGTKPKGTAVQIKRIRNDKSYLVDYFVEHLNGIPSYVAKIQVNRKKINDSGDDKWYSALTELKTMGRTVKQQTGLKIRDYEHILKLVENKGRENMFQKYGITYYELLEKEYRITLTSQGVLVKNFKSDHAGAIISFPSAVQVVEGRDEFKIDDNYRKSVKGVFLAFEKYLHDQEKDKGFIFRMVNFIPSLMSAFAITSLKTIPNLESISKELLPEKKYVLTQKEMKHLIPFLGESLERLAFPASNQGCSYWGEVYGTISELNKDILSPAHTFTPEEFTERIQIDKEFYPNLHLLASQTVKLPYPTLKYDSVELVEVNPPGEDCVMIKQTKAASTLYINIKHRYVGGALDYSKVYSIISDYFHLPEAKKIHQTENDDFAEEHIREITKNIPYKSTKKMKDGQTQK
jgi:hypothetical protein